MNKTTAALLLLLPICAFAQNDEKSYLCIAEQGASVSKSANAILSSYSGEAVDKYLVSKSKGVRYFGIDANWLSQCKIDDSGRPTWCESPGESWGGFFQMDIDNTFVISSMNYSSDLKGIDYYTVAGKCSAL